MVTEFYYISTLYYSSLYIYGEIRLRGLLKTHWEVWNNYFH